MYPVADTVLRTLVDCRFRLATGVPCSLLRGLFAGLDAPDSADRLPGLRYLPAPREDSALGVASGAALAGERAVVLMQNSGLGYCLNVLTSFNLIYDVPVLLIVSWRGSDGTDAVEHQVIGRQLLPLLDTFDLPQVLLDHEDPAGSTRRAVSLMDRRRRCTVLLVSRAI
jgi:sulfopyruvate decarboxylase subunit alpha